MFGVSKVFTPRAVLSTGSHVDDGLGDIRSFVPPRGGIRRHSTRSQFKERQMERDGWVR